MATMPTSKMVLPNTALPLMMALPYM